MYLKQDKTAIRDSLVVADSEISMKKKIVLENIIKYLFNDDLYKYKLALSFNNVLHITDGGDSSPTNVNINGTDVMIETINFLRFQKELLDTNLLNDYRYTKSVIILGCINRMDPALTEKIMTHFNSHVILIYGDSALSLDSEFNNRYSLYFTNIKIDVSENFDTDVFDVSKKKIYNVLSKIRKDVEHEKISRSNVFSVEESDTIDTTELVEFIENEPMSAVVIPELHYPEVNSQVRYFQRGEMNLTPTAMDQFTNVYPIIVKSKKDNTTRLIPSYSNITVCSLDNPEIYITPDNKILCDVDISVDGEVYHNVPFDFGFYISNFDRTKHPDHDDEYEALNSISNLSTPSPFSYLELKCVPYRILKPAYVKYGKFEKIRAYNLTVNSGTLNFMVNNTLYNYICTATDKVELIEGFRFNVL